MGTTRMGADPASACCDSYGRSFEHANLFLAGSGLFPTVDAANPTLTIAALTLRTAAHIVQTFAQSLDPA
jgi:choline dehydrogenase-like flavoprotein